MKFMLFAATALAASQVKRQVSAVTSAVAQISSGTVELDNGIKGFSGVNDAIALETSATKLVDTINSANSAVGALSPLGNDAASLAVPIQDLGKLVQTTVSDLKAKKSAFVSAGLGGVVYDQATKLQAAAKTFTATVLSKVPSNLQSLGNTLAAPIADALTDAVNSFQDQAGNTGSGSGSASSSGAAATSAAAPTSSGAAAATTTGAAAATTSKAAATTTGAAAVTTSAYKGAAPTNAAGFGAVAMVVLAGAAML